LVPDLREVFVRTRAKGQTFAGKQHKLGDKASGVRLIDEIQSVAPHELAVLADAFRESLLEIGERRENSAEEFRSCLLGLILWKIFARGSALWINSQTKAGNAVSLDLLVAAYSMWKNALNLAKRHGVDAAAAAEVLVQVTHATADRIAGNSRNPDNEKIRNLRNYVFASYMYLISDIAAKQGSRQTDYVDMGDLISNREFSDRGAFLDVLESGPCRKC
jgi:hypothetical protein